MGSSSPQAARTRMWSFLDGGAPGALRLPAEHLLRTLVGYARLVTGQALGHVAQARHEPGQHIAQRLPAYAVVVHYQQDLVLQARRLERLPKGNGQILNVGVGAEVEARGRDATLLPKLRAIAGE